jgi:ATP-dependent RNA helicase DeaD
MQTLNRFVGGRQEVGHIDLLDTISYFEVPEKDAKKVMIQLTGIRYKGRQVRCNDANDTTGGRNQRSDRPQRASSNKRQAANDRRELLKKYPNTFIDDEPDFSEEGWAMRKPRKKKK